MSLQLQVLMVMRLDEIYKPKRYRGDEKCHEIEETTHFKKILEAVAHSAAHRYLRHADGCSHGEVRTYMFDSARRPTASIIEVLPIVVMLLPKTVETAVGR